MTTLETRRSPTSRRRLLLLAACIAIPSLLAALVFVGGFVLSNMLLYPYRPHAWWTATSHPPDCKAGWITQGFLDQRSGVPGLTLPKDAVLPPLDMTCAEALQTPGEDRYVESSDHLKIHYRLYGAPNLPKTMPIWLYVHGVTGNYLNGSRYLKAAERLGFQLAAMDLSNHGLSENNGRGAAYGCREAHDVEAVVADLFAKEPGRRLLLTATSMGTMAVQEAAPALMVLDTEHRLRAVALESAIPSVHAIIFESAQAPAVPHVFLDLALAFASARAGYNFDQCRAVDGATQLLRPVLIQQPGADQLIPEALARQVFAALPLKSQSDFRIYGKGRHSQAWNVAPQAFEADLKALWERAQ